MRRMLLACALCSPTIAFAQGSLTTLPDIAVTATRIPTLIEQIPAGVTVITRETIDERGYTTLVDALSAVPGLRVVQSGGPGGNASVFLRGTNSNHVLVLRDGVPISDPSDPGAAFNFGVDTLADVARIEVVRGPMSALYGSGAIGGVINLITRHGAGAATGTVELAVGAPRALVANAGLSGSTGRFDYRLNLGTQALRGFDTTPQRESVYTGARNPYRDQTASLELGVTPVEGTRAFVALNTRSALFNVDELGYPSYDAQNYRGHDSTLQGRIGITSDLLDGAWETALNLSQLSTDRHYIEPQEAADPNATFSDTRYRGRQTTLQWNNTLHLPDWDADWGAAHESAVLFGYQHVTASSSSSENANFGGAPYTSAINANSAADAGHIGVQTTLAHRLTLTADGREDAGRYGGSAFTWRGGASLAVPEAWSRLKASYGTAFRAPSLFDMFGTDTYGYVGNPKLRPEHSQGWEIGYAVDLPGLGRKDLATLEVTYFDNDIRDMIITVFNSSYTASTTQNISRARSKGVEAMLTLRPTAWLDASLSYTNTDARNLADHSVLLRRPTDQVTASLRASPLPGLTITPELVYTSTFHDFLIDDFGYQNGVGIAKAGTILNLTVTYAVTPQITLFATGRNIGTSKFEPVSGLQTPGPQALAGLRARF